MENYYSKIDKALSKYNLKCCRSGCYGQIIQIVGIEGSEYDFSLYFSRKGEILLNNFNGSIRVSDFSEILIAIEKEFKELNI